VLRDSSAVRVRSSWAPIQDSTDTLVAPSNMLCFLFKIPLPKLLRVFNRKFHHRSVVLHYSIRVASHVNIHESRHLKADTVQQSNLFIVCHRGILIGLDFDAMTSPEHSGSVSNVRHSNGFHQLSVHSLRACPNRRGVCCERAIAEVAAGAEAATGSRRCRSSVSSESR
jgi:hypothetical protein